MVTVKLDTDRDSRVLAITGHAGAGKHGSDIVCAAASILAYTAAASMLELYRAGKLKKRPGIHFAPGICRVEIREDSREAEAVFFTVENGLRLLAGKHPENVKIEI